MKMIVVALALVALAAAGPVPDAVAAGSVPAVAASSVPAVAAGSVPAAAAGLEPVKILRSVPAAAAGAVPAAVVAPEAVSNFIKILRSVFEPQEDGSYSYNFETENKIQREETGVLKPLVDEENNTHNVVVVRGSYSYINDLGEEEIMSYWADESGFHAEGPSVPKNAESASRR